MSRLSRCATSRNLYRPLPNRRIVALLLFAGGCFAFAVAQLGLRFNVHDLKQETTRLQSRKMELRSQVNRLKSQVESQKQADRLMTHARAELGMVAYAPADVERVHVAREVRDRYANVELVRARPVEVKTKPRNGSEWAEVVASRLGIDGSAVAAAAEE